MGKIFDLPPNVYNLWKRTKKPTSRLAALMAGVSPIVLGAVVTAVLPGAGDAQAVNLGNNIVADGLTKTKITVQGNHTKISTKTVSAGVAFNTFSDFQQAAGQRVDLFVPDQAGSLVNIVSNGAVVINGELNSFKNGEIGGNVFFSSSNGFIVGASGRVNVGSLTVNTPTQAFLDRIIGSDGRVNNAVAQQLMRGEIPISPNGVIAISGQVNAKGGITLQGHTVTINGITGPVTANDLGQRLKFGATVNSTGLVEGGALVSRGGKISIVAAGNATVGGRINANAKNSGNGGNVSVKTGGDITIEATAEVSADGAGIDGAGGDVIFYADEKITVQDGALFSAHGAGTGDGGFIEISGKYAQIGSARYDLGSDQGQAGSLLFDPLDLVFNAGNTNVTGGGAITLTADNSILVASGGELNSTNGFGPAGNISLVAPKITLADGSIVTAGTTGNVTLTATQSTGGTAEIIIGDGTGSAPVLSGNNITLNATSTADNFSLLVSVPTATASVTITSGTINATGALVANARATTNGDLSTVALPIGVVVTNSSATVDVGGTSDITAGSVTLAARSTVTSNIPTESLAPANSAADGAVAVSTINSTAIARIADAAKVVATGAIDVSAKNKIVSVANATPLAAAFGASVGVSVINAITTAELAGTANLTAASLKLDASTATDVTVTAIAGSGGATEPSAGSKAASFLSAGKYGSEATTSEGKLSIAGALAISDLTSTTKSSYSSLTSATIAGNLHVLSSSENHTAVVADGTAVKSQSGVGVAIGINIAKVKNDAIISSAVSAGSIHMSALSDNPLSTKIGNSFTTISTSGAGAAALGFAGSFALNLIDTQTTATIGSSVAVNITGGGTVGAISDNKTTSSVTAKPAAGGATGSTLGLGASVGLNIIANRSLAELSDSATVIGSSALTLSALATHNITTAAEAGSSGGFSLTPVVALSMVNNTTTARLGTGAALSTIGDVSVSAAQNASTSTTAKADAAGSKAAVGASFALAMVDDQVLATTERNASTGATGSVTFSALGASSSMVEAAASAQGAAAASSTGAAPSGGAPDVDTATTQKLNTASAKQTKAGVGDAKQRAATGTAVANGNGRSASSDGSKISVAAGVAINVQNSTVSAVVPDGKVIATGGSLTLRTASNVTGKATAKGDAVGKKDASGKTPDPAKVGIGAAVSVNSVRVKNDAKLGAASHSAGAVNIEALSLDVAKLMASPASTATKSDVFLASSTSGAGAGKVGVAGSFALNLIDTESSAKIDAGATVAISGNGAVGLTADNQTDTTADAKPVGAGATGADFGIGASVGMNIIANRSVAELADTAVLTGAGGVALSATANHKVTTTAEAGSSGGVSLTPVLALSLVNNTTTARLGSGNTMATTGAVSVSAAQTAATTTTSKAGATGAKAAIGVSLALAIVDDRVVATTARNVSTTGAASSVTFSALGASSSTLKSTATAAGAKEGTDAQAAPTSTDKSVDKTATQKLTSASTKQSDAKVGSTAQRAATTNEAKNNESGRSAKTSEGKLSAAAAVAVNVQKSDVTAVTPAGVDIDAGGSFNVTSANNTNGSASSDGSAVKGTTGSQSAVGIGVAVSVNVINATNTAAIGAGTHKATGVNVTATQGAGAPVDTIYAEAKSGAGGSKVGIAGSLALNIVNMNTSATISSAASVDARTGTSSLIAQEKMLATAIAAPMDSITTTGGKFGLGASVALNLINTNTTAELQDGATMINGTGLTVQATSNIDTVTTASAGAAGGIAIDASVALATLDERTTARVGTGTGMTMGAGTVTISAINTGTNTATSTGKTKGGKVAVGASAALILGGGASDGALNNTSITSATLARGLTAGSLAISASSVRTYDATATATAEGGKFNQTDAKKNDTTGGRSSTATTIDKTKGAQRDAKGKKGGSKVTVAAAAGIASAQDNVSATLGDVTLHVGGAVGVTATNQIGMATSGSGLAANPKSKVGVGIGVGLGIINNKTTATISDGATLTGPGSVTINATSLENADAAYLGKLTGYAVAGATGKKVAIAGAIAVGISTGETKASIGNNVTISNSGAVAVKTENTSHLSAKAVAGAAGLSGTGIGASIAVVVAEKNHTASVGTGSNITASGLSVKALNHKIDGSTTFTFTDLAALKNTLLNAPLLGKNNYYVEAIGGSAGSKTSITGSFAVMVFNDNVTATVGQGSIAAGNRDVTINADNKFLAKALSGAISLSGGTGVGVAGSVIVSSGKTISTLASNAIVTDAASFTNSANAAQDIQAFGVSVTAAAGNAVNGVTTVITSENRAEALMGVGARVTATGAVNVTAKNVFNTFSLAGGAGGGGSNGVGASASVVTVNNKTRAIIADGTNIANRAEINTGGAITISADATETGKIIAAAGAAGGSVAVGAGAAVYILSTTTEALIGNYAKIGNAHNQGSLSLTAQDVSTLFSIGGAASAGVKAGAGAGVGVGVITKSTATKIGSNAVVASGNVVLDAKNVEDLSAITIGLGIGGSAGLAGAVSVYAVTTDTTAQIGSLAQIYANENVAVLADDNVTIDMLEGAVAAGGVAIGASVGVTVIDATTLAKIDNSAQVTALANGVTAQGFITGYDGTFKAYGGSGNYTSANMGDRTATAGASQTGFDLLTKERQSKANNASARGVIVNATGTSAVRSMAVAGGVGGTAVSISASVPIITMDTQSVIGTDAQINKLGSTPSTLQSVSVAAANDVYSLGFSGAVAIGGSAGMGAGVNAAIVNTTTKATVGGGTSNISAMKDILVSADATQDFAIWAIAGAGGGTGALAGSGSALDLTTVTTAQLGGIAVADDNIDVIAHDDTRTGMMAGSVAIGLSGGVGAAVGVILIDKTVTSSVAANSDISAYGNDTGRAAYDGSNFTAKPNSEGLNVEAATTQSALALIVSGAGGLYAGISGVLALDIVTANTSAFIGANSKINVVNTRGSDTQDVIVAATDSTTSSVGAGAVAVGAVGLSGAVDVGIFKTSTSAYIDDGVSINVKDSVFLSGLSNKAGETKVASGSGGVFGLAVGIAIYDYGDGSGSKGEADKQLGESSGGTANMDKVNTQADGQVKNDGVYDLLKTSDNDHVKAVNNSAKAKRDTLSVTNASTPLAIPAGTSANVGNVVINAGGDVSVKSSDELTVDIKTGGFAGGAAAVGAGIAVLNVDTGNTAQVKGAGTNVHGVAPRITANGGVNINAKTSRILTGNSYAGTVGGIAAVSADVVIFKDVSRTKAFAQNQAMTVNGLTQVKAEMTRNVNLRGYGAAISFGGLGAGASVTTATLGGTVDASIIGSNITGTSGTGIIKVEASSNDKADTKAVAASGGAGAALSGAGSVSTISTAVDAKIHSSVVTASHAVEVLATANADADSNAVGVAIAGGLAVAGSVADSTVTTTAKASILAGSTITAGSLKVAAASTTAGVNSKTVGASGALVGLVGTDSTSENKAQTYAIVDGSGLTVSGLVNIDATSQTQQDADASGFAGGLVAGGLNDATAKSTTTTHATLNNLTSLTAGTLTVNANGSDDNTVKVVAGSGGLLAGSAASGTTSAISSTKAAADGASTLNAIGGNVNIHANHLSKFGGTVDSTQASLAGGSGAELYHTVVSNVDAHIGNNTNLNAANLTIDAQNRTLNDFAPGNAWNVKSASGGLASLPAGGATIKINHGITNASIGNDSAVHLLTSGASPLSTLTMNSHSDIVSKQKVKIDSGGAVALADADIKTTAVSKTTLSVGDRASVRVDKGDIMMNNWGSADIDNRAAATTYGLAGAPSGDITINYIGENKAAIGTNARVEVTDGINPVDGTDPTHGSIAIAAGVDQNGADGLLKFNAILDIFNKTAIPIPASPNPTINVNSSGSVAVKSSNPNFTAGNEEGVRAAGDITISASRGAIDANAVGTGKDIYREALAEVASAVSNAFGGGDVSFDYNGGTSNIGGGNSEIVVDGIIQTGIQRFKKLTLRYLTASCDADASSCLAADTTANITYKTPLVSAPVGTEILNRLAELESLIAAYDADPIAKAAYQSEIYFLQTKLVDIGLGTFAAGVFVRGTYAQPSQKTQLLSEVKTIDGKITVVRNELGTASDVGLSGEFSDYATHTDAAFDDQNYGISPNVARTLVSIDSMSTVSTAGTQGTYRTQAVNALAAGNAAANAVASAKLDTEAHQVTITAKTVLINQQQANLSAALVQGDPNAATTARIAIANAQIAIKIALTQIEANAGAIKTQSLAAKTAATTTKTKLGSLLTTAISEAQSLRDSTQAIAAAAGSTAAQQTAAATALTNYNADVVKRDALLVTSATPATNGFLTRVNKAAAGLGAINTSLTTAATAVEGRAAALNSGIVTPADVTTPNKSLEQYVTVWDALTADYAVKSNLAKTASNSSGTPTAFTVEINDVAARLGNLSFNANVLKSSASSAAGSTAYLNAPGDASIIIRNETSNTLKLNNLIIPDYDAGNIRLNGVLVETNADIKNLNAGGVDSNFKQVETARSSSRGSVEIYSEYNTTDPKYFIDGSSDPKLAKKRLAPDIILKTGAVIGNQRGAVKIHSNSGNIYVRGEIKAGSVDILAKNGDFVASYVNGFNHIGGDPASFTDPKLASEAGKGITANGSVSIAARYLNINSTIQSGIANWNLDMVAGQKFTATPDQLGRTQTSIDNMVTANKAKPTPELSKDLGGGLFLSFVPVGIDPTELAEVRAQYLGELAKNPAASPVRVLTIGGTPTQVNIKDYLSGKNEGRLEFNKLYADNYYIANKASGGEFTYSVITTNPNNNIGASYDAKNKQYVVNSAGVKGGYIQLFGQVMNTAITGGKLNVLDGFGTININNSTNIPVILKALSTGEDATGTLRGTEGKIEITDVTGVNLTSPSNPVVSVRKTVYTRDYVPGSTNGVVRITKQTGTIDNKTGNLLLGAVSTSDGGDRTATYVTEKAQRYVWTTGETFTSTVKFKDSSTRLFGADFLEIDNVTKLTAVGNPNSIGIKRLDDGTYLSTDKTQTNVGDTTFSTKGVIVNKDANGNPVVPSTKLNTDSTIKDKQLVASTWSFVDETKNNLTTTSTSTSCNWWTLCIVSTTTYYYSLAQEYTTITTSSLKADYDIAVNFIGSDTGAINVISDNDVVLNGNLENVAGKTMITATGTESSIIQGNKNALLSAQTAVLNASGSIGGIKKHTDAANAAGRALSVNLTGARAGNGYFTAKAGNGNVSAISRGDIIAGHITAAGAATLDEKTSHGNVSLVSYGSILASDSAAVAGGSLVQGWRANLTALGGSIGEAPTYTTQGAWGAAQESKLLHVNTGFTTDQNKRPFGEAPANVVMGLTAVASGDIGIRSTGWSGNTNGLVGTLAESENGMLVNQALSLGGNVTLASRGQILDNNPVQTIDTRTYNQLLGYWDSLGLLGQSSSRVVTDPVLGAVTVDGVGNNNALKQAATVKAFENVKTKQYEQYWAIRNTQVDPTIYDANFDATVEVGSHQYKVLTSYYAGKAKAANLALTDAQANAAALPEIAKYEVEQKKIYHDLHKTVGTQTNGVFVQGYNVTATTTEVAELTKGSVWTERELAFAIAPGALKTVTGTNPVIKDPNVSGRIVTIIADKGIGESVKDNSGNLGVSIRSSLDPALLTPDQKVALAAAERNDLLLTVEGVALPANATAAQIAAFNEYQANVTTPHNAIVEIALGKKYNALTKLEKATLSAAAAGLVTADKTVLTVLNKRPLNFNAAEKLNIDVATAATTDIRNDLGKSFLASRAGAILGRVTTAGETRIKVRSHITNAASNSFISTGDLILEASQGGIGALNAPVRLDLKAGASTTARAQNSVNLEFTNEGLIDTIYSPQDVKLNSVYGSLINANGDLLINILGTKVDLSAANGSVGTPANSLNVGVNLGQVDPATQLVIPGTVTANAQGTIDLRGAQGSKFNLSHARSTSGGTITISAAGESIIDGTVDTVGEIVFISGGRQIFTDKASITSGAGNVSITADSLKMLNDSTLVAAGTVGIKTAGDAVVTAISSASTAIDAVNIEATVGRVFAGTIAGRAYDISATAAGAGVKIVAGLGIGDKTQADDTATDNTVTDVANPLRIITNTLQALAANGSINAAALSDVTLSALMAAQGSIDMTGTGTMDVASVTSGGSQTLTAQGNVAFTQLTTSSLPTEVGNVTVKSVMGTVTGGSINASGAISATAKGNVKVANVTAVNGGLALTSDAGTLNVTNATSGGSQALAADGDVTFAMLKTTGAPANGNSSVTSTNGSVTGGDVTTTGSSSVTGNGVTFGTILAGVNSSITSAGDITGDKQIAGGDVRDNAGAGGVPGSLRIKVIGAANLYLQATTELNLPDLRIAKSLELRSNKITANVTQVPSGPNPLEMTVTGPDDKVGVTADLIVDAPAGVVVKSLRIADTKLATTATRTEVKSAFVPGTLALKTPVQTISVNNRTPLPQSGNNVQVFVPNFDFGLTVDGKATTTNGIVVKYDETSNLTDVLPTPLDGISLTRDTVRNILAVDSPKIRSFGSALVAEEDEAESSEFDGEVTKINGVRYKVFTLSTGPAVLLPLQ